MWDSFKDLLLRNPSRRFTPPLLKGGLIQIFRALDYLHNECKLIHTDIKADNILQEIEDHSILDKFTDMELNHPSPRKDVQGVTVYASRSFELPKVFGGAVLSDFGSAVSGVALQHHDAQPNVYRYPEVMLKTPWSYPVDIWNVGVMVRCASDYAKLKASELRLDRYGICSKVNTCSMVTIRTVRATQPVRTLPRSFDCLDCHLWSCSDMVSEATSFSTKTVCFACRSMPMYCAC